MLNFKKAAHIVLGGTISVGYACFVIQLTDMNIATYFYLIFYCILLFIYSLKTYAIFHSPPTQPNIHSINFDLNLIFAYKLTQERRRQLQLALRDGKGITNHQLQDEYVNQHKKPSFCDICERVQPPRAYHCLICDACIMGKQKHSKLIGFCIGQNNQIAYLTYLLASKTICLYAFISLAIIQFISDNFQKLSNTFELLFVIIIFLLALLFIFYLRQFFSIFSSIIANRTLCEAKDPYLQNLSFGNPKRHITYLQLMKQVINLMNIGESSPWITQIQDAHAQM